jgi:hypothetical protein
MSAIWDRLLLLGVLLRAQYLRMLAATGFGCCTLAAMTALPNILPRVGLLARKAMPAGGRSGAYARCALSRAAGI